MLGITVAHAMLTKTKNRKREMMNNHSKSVGNDCRKRAIKKWGTGWGLLSDEQKQGSIALEVVSVMFSVSASAPTIKASTASVLEHLHTVGQSALYPTMEGGLK